jgi:lactate permease
VVPGALTAQIAAAAAADPLTGVDAVTWALAVAPVVLLLGLVLSGRFGTLLSAAVTLAAGVALAGAVFGAGPEVLAVGLGKGAWVGIWILAVIWPALLLHHLAGRIGMRELGESLSGVLPRPTENVLLLAWVLPSFLQGVAGFGTPIAVCAPLLVAIGIDATRAVALPLVGYHWAVGFGSMGSSFYMGALTANMDAAGTDRFAGSLALILGVNVVVSGVLVAALYDGWQGVRDGWRVLVTVGPVMAGTQAAAVQGEPAVGALCGGSAGLVAILLLRRALARRDGAAGDPRPAGSPAGARAGGPGAAFVGPRPTTRAWAAGLPYLVLAVTALAVFLPPALRGWVKSHALLGPDFPATATTGGRLPEPTVSQGVTTYNPIALLGHPGTFLLVSALVAVAGWHWWHVWRPGTWAETRGPWLRQAWKSSPSVVLLASVAGVLVDSGMVRAIATGAAEAAGRAYPVAAPFIGALGSFITGSTTSSNALFAALQHDVAALVGDQPADLLAAQTAGANVGNSLAPVVLTLGVVAVGNATSVTAVLRRTAGPAVVLLGSVLTTTVLLVLVHR